MGTADCSPLFCEVLKKIPRDAGDWSCYGKKKIPRRARDYEAAAILIAGDGLCKEFNGFDERTIAVAIEGTERPFGGDTSRKFPVMGGASGFIDGAVLTDFDID